MACEVVTFQSTATAGNTQVVSLSNDSLNPNAIILQTAHTANLGTLNTGLNHCTGVWSSKGNQCCMHARKGDGAGSAADSRTATAAYCLMNSSGSVIEEFRITSVSAGSVTITVDTAGDRDKYINMLCIEADDAWVGYDDSKGSAGIQSHGDGDLDFEGDALFMLLGHNTAMDDTEDVARDCIGWAISSSNRGANSNSYRSNDTERASIHSVTDVGISYSTPNGGTPAVITEADFSAWADGSFGIDWETVHANPRFCCFLVLKGNVWLDESHALRTSTGTTDVTAPGFEPDFVYEQSSRATGTTRTSSYALAWGFSANDAGAGAGSTGCCYSNGGLNEANLDRELNGTAEANTLLIRDDSAGATVLKRFHVQEFDASGFTRDYNTADGTAMNALSFAYAKAAAAAADKHIMTLTGAGIIAA